MVHKKKQVWGNIMSNRRNFMLDDEAAELLDKHADDNHSEIIRELVKAYYTAGMYDPEDAALSVRKQEIERQITEMQAQMESLQEEREKLEELVDDTQESDIEELASEISINDPAMATADNPGIRNKAQKNGVDPAVLAEVVREQAEEEQLEQFSALS